MMQSVWRILQKIKYNKYPIQMIQFVWIILQTGSFLGKKRALFPQKMDKIIFLTALLSFAFSFFLAVFTVLQVYPKTRFSTTFK